MMTMKEIETATAEQLAEELAAAGEYTEDWERATLDELRDRVRQLVATYARTEAAPKYSPWGQVQRVYVLADGVQFVSTASHGGMKLNRKRNAEMPAALRRKGGWYEEDVEQALVLVGLPNLFRPEQVDEARKTVKNWFPDEYEAWTGETLTTEESFVKAERQFAIDNADNYVVVAAWGDWCTKVPKGMVGVAATKGGNRNNDLKWFFVSSEEYKGRSRFGFVIDENRHRPTDPIS